MRPPPQPRWAAQADGVGHAFVSGRGRSRPPLCGLPGWEERYDHPPASRCQACTDGLNELMKAALRGPMPTRRAW